MEYNVKNVFEILQRIERNRCEHMKAEKYLLNYIINSNLSTEQVKSDIGIDIAEVVHNNDELMAEEFLKMCVYLGINPEDVMHAVI